MSEMDILRFTGFLIFNAKPPQKNKLAMCVSTCTTTSREYVLPCGATAGPAEACSCSGPYVCGEERPVKRASQSVMFSDMSELA